jgi:hypothetical protein
MNNKKIPRKRDFFIGMEGYGTAIFQFVELLE